MNKKQLLERAIKRSQSAYEIYLPEKKYHQALHIYKANQVVYQLLVAYSEDCEEILLRDIFQYIFHLEDWFAQFLALEASTPELEDTFIFEKLQFGISYPKEFCTKLI